MKNIKKLVAVLLTTLFVLSTMQGIALAKSSKASVTITYGIWDKNQLPGMKAMADAFTKKNPGINVKVEVTSWDQYWTKLEAAATGGALPDVFWMHQNQFVRYASNNMLMDITDKVKSSSLVKLSNFPKGLVDAATLDGKLYGLPKDYDTIALWYNKTMFDAKKISYPDASWDWNKLLDVAKKLTDPAKKIYGFGAPMDTQSGYYNFVSQNGGYIVSPDKKKSGYDLKATKDAIQWDVDLSQKYKVSPTQAQFADTGVTTMFESGKVAMALFGSWMVSEFKANDYVKKNCNLAVIPHGKQKASVFNGLMNSVSAKSKHAEEAFKFVEYMGTKEANVIQAQYGSAIPAYNGTFQPWVDFSKGFNVKVYPEMLSYAVQFANSKTKSKWGTAETEIMTKVWSKKLSVEDGCNQLAKQMNDLLATEK